MEKLDKLTEEQEKQLIEFREHCLQIGLSTERMDRTKHKEYVDWIYKEYLNIDTPPTIWYVDSPLQYNLIINILYNLSTNKDFKDNLTNNLTNNLWDNLWNNLRNSLRNNLTNNLTNNLWDNLWNNLTNNLTNNLWDNLWNNLRNSLRNNLTNNLRNTLGNTLGNNLWNNLRDNFGDNLTNNLTNNLWDNLWNNLRNTLGNNLRDNLKIFYNIYWSNLDIYWIAFYMFPLLYLNIDYGKKQNEHITKFYEFFQNTGYVFFHKNICFISERPIEINKKEIQLHAENKPALLFADGYCLWYLNGVKVPKELVLTPASELDSKLVLTEKNAEVRREIVRKIGINKVISDLGAKSIETSKDGVYELLNFDIIDGRYRPYLKMKNPSIQTWHVEGIHPDCKTIDQALGFRNPKISKQIWSKEDYKYEHPSILT